MLRMFMVAQVLAGCLLAWLWLSAGLLPLRVGFLISACCCLLFCAKKGTENQLKSRW